MTPSRTRRFSVRRRRPATRHSATLSASRLAGRGRPGGSGASPFERSSRLHVLVGRSAECHPARTPTCRTTSAIAFGADMTQNGGQSRVVDARRGDPQPERIVAAVRAGAAAWVRKDESNEFHPLGCHPRRRPR